MKMRKHRKINMGIAVVTSTSDIRAVIDHPELEEMRKQQNSDAAPSGPTLDSVDERRPATTQRSRPKQGAPIEIPIPTERQFTSDLGKLLLRRKPPQS
jgi:hypothetical protein